MDCTDMYKMQKKSDHYKELWNDAMNENEKLKEEIYKLKEEFRIEVARNPFTVDKEINGLLAKYLKLPEDTDFGHCVDEIRRLKEISEQVERECSIAKDDEIDDATVSRLAKYLNLPEDASFGICLGEVTNLKRENATLDQMNKNQQHDFLAHVKTIDMLERDNKRLNVAIQKYRERAHKKDIRDRLDVELPNAEAISLFDLAKRLKKLEELTAGMSMPDEGALKAECISFDEWEWAEQYFGLKLLCFSMRRRENRIMLKGMIKLAMETEKIKETLNSI